jgi:citrate synthase
MDGEKGILRYRGIPVEQLAEQSVFVETAYLLINSELPSKAELNRFSNMLNDHSLVHEDMKSFFANFPRRAHPMGILSSMVNGLRAFYPELPQRNEEEEINITFTRLLSKVRTLAAMSYKISLGHKVVYPSHHLSYCANFLNMMFDSPVRPYVIDADLVQALNVFWILHADHEQNCSTSAIRLVGSARVNLYAAISAGIAALWGPLHGGANQAVVEMLQQISDSGGDPGPYITRAKDKNDPFRLLGFGHRVYKSVMDPRTIELRSLAKKLAKMKDSKWFEIAEEVASFKTEMDSMFSGFR